MSSQRSAKPRRVPPMRAFGVGGGLEASGDQEESATRQSRARTSESRVTLEKAIDGWVQDAHDKAEEFARQQDSGRVLNLYLNALNGRPLNELTLADDEKITQMDKGPGHVDGMALSFTAWLVHAGLYPRHIVEERRVKGLRESWVWYKLAGIVGFALTIWGLVEWQLLIETFESHGFTPSEIRAFRFWRLEDASNDFTRSMIWRDWRQRWFFLAGICLLLVWLNQFVIRKSFLGGRRRADA